jgi:hypothetical protein
MFTLTKTPTGFIAKKGDKAIARITAARFDRTGNDPFAAETLKNLKADERVVAVHAELTIAELAELLRVSREAAF